MAVNKKAASLAGVGVLLGLCGVASLVLGFIYAPIGTIIGVGIAVGLVIVGFICLGCWAGLYSLFGGDLDTLGVKSD